MTIVYLIPNDRVITNSDPTGDLNLVEGIVYKIVHRKSGSKLDINDDKGYVSSASSPYQYWSLRKADDNSYNIVSVGKGLNLDANGKEVYVSAPQDNSTFNPYQRWVFTKTKNNVYNIAHVNELKNLDSNGKDTYISTPKDNSQTNPYQHWSFEPVNFKLSAVVTNFTYPLDLKEKLNRYKKRISLLIADYKIKNPTKATIVE